MNIYTTPTHDEFFKYAQQHGWADWAEELWEEMNRTNWLKNNGTIPKNWQTIVNVRNGALMNKLGVSINKSDVCYRRTRKYPTTPTEDFKEDEEFPESDLHYVCYTDGSCDNISEEHAGGAAYIILKNGKIIKEKNHGQLHTTNNRMELLAIISAVNSCPPGAFVDIYTDSQYCILVLSNQKLPKKNPDLYKLYVKCSTQLAGIRFHWVKGHNGNKYNEQVDELAYGAYCDICDLHNITKNPRH